VDVAIKSADAALRQEFDVGLTDSDVHVLDPFTGTGTFMVRLLQSGLIKPNDLARKYQQELHANEIILLAYYIAAINIEETYHGLVGGEHQPFEGIVLTDTFQMSEGQGSFRDAMFPENNQRVAHQNQRDIRVIIANPPYSAKQNSENDSNKNLDYTQLDARIRQTYAVHSSATNKNNLYDSYIRAIRWASDRIKDRGVVCYVSNGSFIDGNAMDGLRKCLTDEFTAIYCFNLRGNARTSGEQRRMEKGNVFGAGTRTAIAITLLIKNPAKMGECRLFYHDIGDYLSQEEKLKIIQEFQSIKGIPWSRLTPNDSHDWINQRDPAFERFLPLGDKEAQAGRTVFDLYSAGVKTSKDAWAYNFSKHNLEANMGRMIAFYNEQMQAYKAAQIGKTKDKRAKADEFVDNDPNKIAWGGNLKSDLENYVTHHYGSESVVQAMYRPFCKQWLYFNRRFNERVYQTPKIFPNPKADNLVIYVSGAGGKDASTLILNVLPDLNLQHSGGQGFPLFTYESKEGISSQLPGLGPDQVGYVRKDTLSDSVLADFRKTYDNQISKEDIFYYVYGILHSPEYKRRFESDLKKLLPRIPLVQDFWAFSKAGRDLATWHLNYETIEPYPLQEFSRHLSLNPKEDYRVQKMTFGRRGKEIDKTTIIYNSNVTLSGIPPEAYGYVVNGKSALEWIMERYQVTKDKDTEITNNPNDWSEDPRYIIDLVKRMVRVSQETMNIVNGLPALNERAST
jgi:predicted helicase